MNKKITNFLFYFILFYFVNLFSTITDDDIEKVLLRGEEKTQELENKYAQVGLDDLQKFTSDTGNAYEWEGHDFSAKVLNIFILILFYLIFFLSYLITIIINILIYL